MQQKYVRVAEIKAQTDQLLTQLSEGTYSSLSIWGNNLVHLEQTYGSFGPYLSDANFLAWLNQHDAVMVSEIAMTGRALMALQNLLLLATKKAE